jgi:hypothetical protein
MVPEIFSWRRESELKLGSTNKDVPRSIIKEILTINGILKRIGQIIRTIK